MFIFLQTFYLFCFKLWVQHLKCAFGKKKLFEATSSPNPFFLSFFLEKCPVDLHRGKQLPGVIVLAKTGSLEINSWQKSMPNLLENKNNLFMSTLSLSFYSLAGS